MNCQACQDHIVDALYGELSDAQREAFDAHRETCEECEKLHAEMRATLGVMSRRSQADPGQAFWDGYYNRLNVRMEREAAQPSSIRAAIARVRAAWGEMSVARYTMQAAGAAALVIIGIAVGRAVFPTQPDQVISYVEVPGDNGGAVVQPMTVTDRAVDFLDQAQVILLGLINTKADDEGNYEGNVDAQRGRASELVQEADALRDELTAPEDRPMLELVEELQLILMQVSMLQDEPDMDTIELLQNVVERQGLMFRINLQMMTGGADKKTRRSI